MKIILSIALLISLNVHAGTTTKREFIKDGIVYVETTTIEKNGFTSVETLPKKGQDTTTVKQVATKNGGVKTTI